MLQIRIHVGDRRETFECLHQGIGQQFDIEAGKACAKVFVLKTRRMTVTLLEPITTLFQYLTCQLFSEASVLFYMH